MDKLTMAHEYAMKALSDPEYNETMETLVKYSWLYADAMQAEADKRNIQTLSAKQETVIDDVKQDQIWSAEDWQPDWSQAPDGYDWFAVDQKGTAYFYSYQPETMESENYWADFTGVSSSDGMALESKTTFGYQGDWRNSLRKRPELINSEYLEEMNKKACDDRAKATVDYLRNNRE